MTMIRPLKYIKEKKLPLLPLPLANGIHPFVKVPSWAPVEEERKFYLCNGCPGSFGQCLVAWDEDNKEPEVQPEWNRSVLFFCLNK